MSAAFSHSANGLMPSKAYIQRTCLLGSCAGEQFNVYCFSYESDHMPEFSDQDTDVEQHTD